MTTTAPGPELLDELSRELWLVCELDGRIVSADQRAKKLFGDCLHGKLAELATPGTESIVTGLLERAAAGIVRGVELSIVCDGKPVTLACSAAPSEGRIVICGNLYPNDQSARLADLDETMSELAELHRQTERQRRELARQRDDLDASNRGLRVLHAELDDKNEALRRAVSVKGRVVASVSHEFRTPINSIVGLSRLLLERMDGPLTPEQEVQVRFIRNAADTLRTLVDDLLDLAKLEAGKAGLRMERFTGSELLAAVRGMMGPLATNEHVALIFENDESLVLDTDQGKLSQILRNLVSNALKFTERGEIRVRARATNGSAEFVVSDTGIGIAPEHLETIFEEFTQIDSAAQRKVRGTGLGLALSRRLAELLGGTLTVSSKPGDGSVFTLRIPRVHDDVREMESMVRRAESLDPTRAPILVVEDDRTTLFLYERYLRDSGFQVLPARSVDQARELLSRVRPAAVLLDVLLEGESTWNFLEELKESERTRDIPVMVVTVMDTAEKARALGADEFWLKPIDPRRLLDRLGKVPQHVGGDTPLKVLVIDDDESSRYVLRKFLAGTPYGLIEANTGRDGLRLAHTERPNLILLDLILPSENAFDILDELKSDMTTRGIPVVIHTAKDLDEGERRRLEQHAASIVPKKNLSRELAIARIREALIAAGIGVRITSS